MGSKINKMPSKKLTIELIPQSSWNNNLRTLLGKEKWQILRKKVLETWGEKCAICGVNTKKLDCHEVWEFNTKSSTQNLKDIIPLCKNCHAVKHIGLSELQSSKGERNFKRLITHYMKVNKCTRYDFEKDKKEAYEMFEKRSKLSWKLALNNIDIV